MTQMKEWPPCGLYRTLGPIGPVPEGRLVYFHNHGDPGPGVYLPEGWERNRARFATRGVPLQGLGDADKLQPLLAEGLYRVEQAFTCCNKNCMTFPVDLLVQLGYNGNAEAILFTPQWGETGLVFPERGQRVDASRLARLQQLHVASSPRDTGPRLH